MTLQDFNAAFIQGEWANRNVVVRIYAFRAEVIDFAAHTATSIYGGTKTELKFNLHKEMVRRGLINGKGRPKEVRTPSCRTQFKQRFDACYDQRSIIRRH